MSINKFFSETLGASVRNSRWSWGATDAATNRVFLRVWEDEIEKHGRSEYVLVAWHEYDVNYASNGIDERYRHVAEIMEGAEGYGVVCKPRQKGNRRKIASFDRDVLLHFGAIEEWENCTMARVTNRVPVSELARSRNSQTDLIQDLGRLARRKIETTEKESLSKARIGQGRFRADVLHRWNNACAVTGCDVLEIVRASHIKPWRDCTDEERLDPLNGLPLVANLDALFDNGLITFDSQGKMLVSNSIPESQQSSLGLRGPGLLKSISNKTRKYLKYHRANVFQNG